ncbi:hypothetical protein C0992_004944, partial [Termitomyces sp. T32_za158]
MYHLPLLPGYSHKTKVRSSKAPNRKSILVGLLETEEIGYQETYFSIPIPQPSDLPEGFISTSPSPDKNELLLPSGTGVEPEFFHASLSEAGNPHQSKILWQSLQSSRPKPEDVAEVIVFEYGVVVFFGLHKRQERDILKDIAHSGSLRRPLAEDQWEVEECNFA